MGSRNGTFVAGRRLDSGERVQLVAGSTVSLGGLDTTWTLVDASPPGPAARAQDNVDIYRARREFAAAGLQGGTAIVERRQGSPQVRLGADNIRIEPL